MRKKPSGSSPVTALLALLALLASGAAAADDIQDLQSTGAMALAAGDYYGAIESFASALRINAHDLDSYVGTAEAYYWLGEYDQAEVHAARARELSRLNAWVLTLSGRIAIGLGEVDVAREYFSSAKSVEPNNVDADIGLAELALAEGRSLDAAMSLERALSIHPDNRKALLSLVLIYEQARDYDTAEEYLNLALDTHGDEPETHILAAEFDLRRGLVASAAAHARTAQAIDVHSRAAARIRASAALIDGRFLEAVATSEEMLRTYRTDAAAWFLRGQALAGIGRIDEAMDSYRTALRYHPDNEMVRLVAESLAIREYPMDADVRAELAQHAAERAARFSAAFRYTKALTAYQQALRLTPFDAGLRLDYAELHLTLGHRATYLQELRVIASAGQASADINRRISVYANALSESVAERWNIDQFTLQKSTTTTALYLLSDSGPLTYPLADFAVLENIERALQGLERIDVRYSGPAALYSQAFSEARSHDVDFFITLKVADTPRTMELEAQVYVARTGVSVATFSVSRVGPERVADATAAFVRRLDGLFPLTSTIVARVGDRVVVDAGSRDGLASGAELIVVPPEAVLIDAGSIGLSYDTSSVLGVVRITERDDLIAEGTIEVDGLVDAIVVGDIAVVPGESVGERSTSTVYPLLYDRVRSLR